MSLFHRPLLIASSTFSARSNPGNLAEISDIFQLIYCKNILEEDLWPETEELLNASITIKVIKRFFVSKISQNKLKECRQIITLKYTAKDIENSLSTSSDK